MAVCNFRRIWDAYLNGRERPNDLKLQPRNEDGDDVVGGVAHGECIEDFKLQVYSVDEE